MQTYEIWSEGYPDAKAFKLTSTEVSSLTSFREACNLVYASDSHYDSRKNTYWGCKLFDNEQDARKSFG